MMSEKDYTIRDVNHSERKPELFIDGKSYGHVELSGGTRFGGLRPRPFVCLDIASPLGFVPLLGERKACEVRHCENGEDKTTISFHGLLDEIVMSGDSWTLRIEVRGSIKFTSEPIEFTDKGELIDYERDDV